MSGRSPSWRTPWSDRAMNHVVLLGDSIFDNAAYVGGAPDVVRQVRQR
ncbi:MAG: SGNH/GDSL hydrolase family protein, partial [Actinomycetota bacterium]|nr:SGNH/GDSL hydrolase family protein [Actinomycetota bacterium]